MLWMTPTDSTRSCSLDAVNTDHPALCCSCCILLLPHPGLSIFSSPDSQSQLWVLIPRRASPQKADYPSFHCDERPWEQEVLQQAQISVIQRLHRILNWKQHHHPRLCLDITTLPAPSYSSEITPRCTRIHCSNNFVASISLRSVLLFQMLPKVCQLEN